MLLAPFLWGFCEFDEKVLDNLSLVHIFCISLRYPLKNRLFLRLQLTS